MAARPVPDKNFEVVAAGLLGRQRLQIGYYSRVRDVVAEREVSPQLLIHYRGNWYLGAWCHKQEAMRSFSMDAIQKATVVTKTSKSIAKNETERLHWPRLWNIFRFNHSVGKVAFHGGTRKMGVARALAPESKGHG